LRENFTNMLIRFVLDNIFSFGEQKEFNLFPNKRLGTLQHHKYQLNDIELLKLSAIYGANGAGKSNLVRTLSLLQSIVIEDEILYKIKDSQFKFQKNGNNEQTIAIEFIEDNTAFYYGLEIIRGTIITEELYESGLGNKVDRLIYERKTDNNKTTTIKFLDELDNTEKGKILKEILIQEFIKPNKPILKLISDRDNEFLRPAKKAYNWFENTLTIISPYTKPMALAHRIDIDGKFKNYAEDIMCSFNVGITRLSPKKILAEDFFGKNNEKINNAIKNFEESTDQIGGLRINTVDEIILEKEGDKIYVKILQLEHIGKNNVSANFNIEEESDGTIRLLDFAPAFYSLISERKVYVIDEIERSLHPLLIKELINKFASDKQTKGQLVFTTHESNLLDQDIFRQDEIWFAEKDKNGCTDLYSLSSFKEHKTIDIQKGYLNGRYGAIPFLGNLQDLNWHKYDTIKG
jgi:uncharacterized protein